MPPFKAWQWVRANRRLARGLVRDYRADREDRVRAVRLVGHPGGTAPL